MQPTQPTSTKRRIIVAAIIAACLAAVAAAAVFALTRPSQDDFKAAKAQIPEAVEARKGLAPAVNDYLAAFKKAYNQSKSVDKASRAAKPEYDAYQAAAAKASAAMQKLADNRAANDADAGSSIRQLKQDYDAEVTYYTGLVESYPEYTALFAQGSDGCSGIFVGQADGLADRKKKLDAAASRCYEALDELKRSRNASYVDYAKKVETRLKRLQADAATTVAAEKKLKEYQQRAQDYQQQYAEAKKRNASEEEILKLADELKAFNAEIADNRATFDFAADNYLDTVKEMPSLYSDVYATAVPAKLKYYTQLIGFRSTVLGHVIDSHIVDEA